MWKNVVNYIGCDAGYDEARVVIYGAPFDSTTSFRPGTRFAGQAVRNDSYGLETYSPYQDLELTEGTVYDCGDLELAIGDPGIVLEQIRETAEKILQDGKLPFMIGGEHLVTLGAVRAAAQKYPDMHIIHFDAHTDLRTDYLGVELSHACVIRRCWELLGDGRIHQLGIRSGEKYEFDWAKSGHTDFHPFVLDDLEAVLESVGDAPVYFTVDLDVMDPSVFPGTGTPEPGGVDFLTLMRAVTNVCGRVNLIGCDVNELCPPCDPTGASTAVACKIIREMLTAIVNRENGQTG
ncbi:MAG TPA: agmatinase [Candidatus Mediterraneibacter intestinavium]|nr:agmatinase [Candidatus Mediterraneibacter intestinavium]